MALEEKKHEEMMLNVFLMRKGWKHAIYTESSGQAEALHSINPTIPGARMYNVVAGGRTRKVLLYTTLDPEVEPNLGIHLGYLTPMRSSIEIPQIYYILNWKVEAHHETYLISYGEIVDPDTPNLYPKIWNRYDELKVILREYYEKKSFRIKFELYKQTKRSTEEYSMLIEEYE